MQALLVVAAVIDRFPFAMLCQNVGGGELCSNDHEVSVLLLLLKVG